VAPQNTCGHALMKNISPNNGLHYLIIYLIEGYTEWLSIKVGCINGSKRKVNKVHAQKAA